MKFEVIVFVILVKTIYVENRMIPMPLLPASRTSILTDETTLSTAHFENHLDEKGEDIYSEGHNEYEAEKNQSTTKKPCAIVVLSNLQNPNVQSLLRKYRYDANGLLIPSSVQYFIKLPQGLRRAPVLVPLNDKSFSPLGGFVRYYKEVPPIPRSWRR